MLDQDRLAQERRARLAAEHFFEQKKSELAAANDKIAAHARTLTDEIIQTREQAKAARSEAETIKGEYTQVQTDLHLAQEAAVIAERRLWNSLETIRDGFAVFDRHNTLIVANHAYLSVFDDLECAQPGSTYDDLVKVSVEEGIIDTDNLAPDEWVEMMNARWRGSAIEPITLRLWNNQFIRLMDRRTQDGDTVSLALNITSSMRRLATLTKSREKAEAASRAKSSFLANMSHEIRTPMNGMVAMADLLSESKLDEEQQLYVETIRNSGEALLGIINDILDYSKIEAGKLVLNKEPFNLESAIHQVLTLVQATAREKGLDLIVDYDMFLPTTFEADPGRFRQILTNLIGNAVKFTNEGHVLVRVVGVPVEDGAGQKIHITVEDTGIGIPADKKDHVFGEFNQAESDTKRSFDGTGLGLAIARQLVRMMGGDIWVDSEYGVGSSFGFSVSLPVVEPADLDGAMTPCWIDRGFVIDASPTSQLVLEKQVASLGLQPVPLLSLLDLAEARPTEADILFLANPKQRTDTDQLPGCILPDLRAAASVVILPAHLAMQPDAACAPEFIPMPVLRRDLLNRLNRMSAPDMPEIEDEEPSVAGGVSAETAAREKANPIPGRAMRVLAAEDNKTNRLVLSKMLKSLDIDLVFAEDGAQAIEFYKVQVPDIFFTDISMPVMDGKDAARQIRHIEEEEGRERMPIVAMTAHAMEGDKDEILASGIDHYLTKPLKKAALVGFIQEAAPHEARPPVAEDDLQVSTAAR